MTGDYNDFGSFVGECELNLCFPDFLGKNEKIQLGSAGRFLQNLRIEKILDSLHKFCETKILMKPAGTKPLQILDLDE